MLRVVRILLVFSFAIRNVLSLFKHISHLSLGVDIGTSGVRLCIVDEQRNILTNGKLQWAQQNLLNNSPSDWINAIKILLDGVPANTKAHISSICISGTSATTLTYDTYKNGVSRGPLMYDYSILNDAYHGGNVMSLLHGTVSAPNSPTSTLAKLLMWHAQSDILSSERLLHQADFVSNYLIGRLESGQPVVSDWHNCLKLGFDPHTLRYPEHLLVLLDKVGIHRECLPIATEPGRAIGRVTAPVAELIGLNPACRVAAGKNLYLYSMIMAIQYIRAIFAWQRCTLGTTDSIAAFIASGACDPGQAVTSLGSTLVIKALSSVPVQDAARGIYSHRWGDNLYLVGGASNVGCAVLRQEGYSEVELRYLTESGSIDAFTDSAYDYYPLIKPGERFPVCDPLKQPILDPKPLRVRAPGRVSSTGTSAIDEVDRGVYLHALLQGIAKVEQQGYAALEQLGATSVTEVFYAAIISSHVILQVCYVTGS